MASLLKPADLLKLWGTLRQQGIAKTARRIENSLRARIERRVDARLGLDTIAWVPVTELTVDSPNKGLANIYGPTPAWLIPRFLGSIPEDLSKLTFIDFGSGKGRVLLLAGQHPLHRVIGLEFSKELHAEATANIERFRSSGLLRCGSIESVESDVLDFELPDEDCVLYTYNPFGTEIMRRLLERIEASYRRRPRKLYFIYYDSVDDALFAASSVFQEIPLGRLGPLHRLVMPHRAKLYVARP